MKNIYSNHMVAHLWANRSQEHARNPRSTLYFEGDTIYSYGQHFPIARHLKRKGKRAVLFTTRRYCITTTSQCCLVWQSINRTATPVFHVPNVAADSPEANKANFSDYMDRLRKLANGSKRTRSGYEWTIERFRELGIEAQAYARFVGLSDRLPVREMADMLSTLESQREWITQHERKVEDRRAIDRERAAARMAEAQRLATLVVLPQTLLRIRGLDCRPGKWPTC